MHFIRGRPLNWLTVSNDTYVNDRATMTPRLQRKWLFEQYYFAAINLSLNRGMRS